MIATTIEQSKHLLELGLDPKTADMCFEMEKWNWTLNVGKKSAQVNRGFAVPAWSLSALLEVISKVTCISYLTIDTSFLIRCKDLGFLWQKDIAAKDPVDAAYEMVCWLLENNLIKKGGQDESNNRN